MLGEKVVGAASVNRRVTQHIDVCNVITPATMVSVDTGFLNLLIYKFGSQVDSGSEKKTPNSERGNVASMANVNIRNDDSLNFLH